MYDIRVPKSYLLHPLNANIQEMTNDRYIGHDIMVTSDGCKSEHSKNHEKYLTFLYKEF